MKPSIKKYFKIFLLGLIAFFLIGSVDLIYTYLEDQPTSSIKSLPEYNSLFANDEIQKLQILTTSTTRNRLPVSIYLYDNTYNICVFPVTLFEKRSLNKIIDYQNEASYIHMNAVYSGLPGFKFTMNMKAGKTEIVNKLNFQFSGYLINPIIKKDSLYCFYIKFKTFSINYNNAPYDIIAKADQSAQPANVLFLEKSKKIYVVILTLAKEGNFNPNLLYNIIKK